MTREEASFILANIDRRVCDDELIEALEMAIKALEQEPSGDLISREWLKTAIHNFYYGLKHTPTEEDIQAYIDVAPSVKQERTGHWYSDCRNDYFICNQCKAEFERFSQGGYELIDDYNYCPNCGARMVEPQEGRDKE